MKRGTKKRLLTWGAIAGLLVVIFTLLPAEILQAQGIPKITLGVDQANNPEDVSTTLQILLMMTVLALAPAILILMTSFTRIIVVFFFVRQALGTNQMPPNQLLIGLALFLTFFIMSPVLNKMNTSALQPYMQEEITQQEAFANAMEPLREFMVEQTDEKDLGLFMKISQSNKPNTIDDVSNSVLIPSFVISELRTAFQIGFVLYIPFLVIDMVVAGVLMSMGMMMLPPVMISLPFKILLFILVDGWNLLVGSVVNGFF
ncbi:MAG: flagellar type III secretion system pore protein FliP [Candidatus Marinimicrobia bacterium]|nr:flagellar type III secretion system pore protein FliP [Candidatus Neomarinimicrobiota bacterium]MCF7880513.1 flagellar type III secretion system pore protein FliP [Candidatus Neomarinimicrobiota bacterium]